MKRYLVAGLVGLFASHAALSQSQGVTGSEIKLGTVQDLSGPIAAYGKQAVNGMRLRIDEINSQGGVRGRKLNLIVEDSGYDPKRAVLAAQKLISKDNVFMMVGLLGTPTNMAAMPVIFDNNVVNFFPLAPAREMYEAPNKLKYAFLSTTFDQARSALPPLIKEKNAKRACIVYQDDELGLEIVRGSEAGLKSVGMDFVEKTSYKRGATDFSSQMARLKSANCDLIVLGTSFREAVGCLSEARKLGFAPTFLGASPIYTDLLHKLGGRTVEGVYATMTVEMPYLEGASKELTHWASKYKTAYGDDPSIFSVYGYFVIDAFVAAAGKTGPALSTDSFIKAMDTMTLPRDIFGSDVMTFSATKRLGSDRSRLSQIVDGRWRVLSDYVKPAGN